MTTCGSDGATGVRMGAVGIEETWLTVPADELRLPPPPSVVGSK
ncbi:MAG TPA: hypothetical protein VHV55_24435 [Pirellulales bacterium]|nr:hypothetical protein [Pirellulales bacterium]